MTATFTSIEHIKKQIAPFVVEAAKKLGVHMVERNSRTIIICDAEIAVKVMEQALAIAIEQKKRSAK